jgi:hypothetical protein
LKARLTRAWQICQDPQHDAPHFLGRELAEGSAEFPEAVQGHITFALEIAAKGEAAETVERLR